MATPSETPSETAVFSSETLLDNSPQLESNQGKGFPHQPRSFRFLLRSFGWLRRSFRAEWFSCHSWLHYDEGKDLAFCYLCMQARKENKLTSSTEWLLLATRGFSKAKFYTRIAAAARRLFKASILWHQYLFYLWKCDSL